jgi:hypothetical protein
MNRSVKPVIGAVLVFFVGVAGAACWFNREEAKRAPDIVSVSRFDSILSKDIRLATSLADIPDLREDSLGVDDIEVRIWRGHSLSTLEGVFVKRVNGEWSGFHLSLKSDEHGKVQAAEVKQLKAPESGWQIFLGELGEKGLFMLPLTPENECDTSSIDGILYIVEISQNNTYRNYQYPAGDHCRESKQMTEIGEIIGLEFDSGQEQCKEFEWFACMRNRKAESLPSPSSILGPASNPSGTRSEPR